MKRDPVSSNEGPLILAIKEKEILVAPEGAIDIHLGIVNQGDNEDYVDIQVKGVPSDWVTLDMPVVHLAAGEAKEVVLTVQAPPIPQSRVGQYPLDVYAISQNDPEQPVVIRSFLTVAAFRSGGRIGAMLGSIYFSVVPGSSITIPILLQNNGLKEDVFQLSIDGIPANWISTNAIFTKLGPSESQEIEFTLRVPRSPEAGVGRTPFKIHIISHDFPDQKAEVECILTVAAFSKFSASLHPALLQTGQLGYLVINNEGNTADTYHLSFQSPANLLIFEKEIQVSQTGTRRIETAYIEIPQDEKIQVASGEQGKFTFCSKLKSRPMIGDEKTYPFTAKILSAENVSLELQGDTSENGLLHPWLATTLAIGSLVLCLLLFLVPLNRTQAAISATQTASFQLTQVALAALSGQQDSDDDGLTNAEEAEIGTDPFKADTDGDGLSDRQEVHEYKTNPLIADTDGDGLSDGDEVLRYGTGPLNPDADGDGLNDGDEIRFGANPLSPDTDGDGLSDGDEIRFGANPLKPDTDGDGLLDGQENQVCPRLLDPDSDGDGILDGRDLEPCDLNNPLLTATAISAVLTQSPLVTEVPPTNILTETPVATNTAVVPPTNTAVVPPTPTPLFPPLQGVILFDSNRDSNSDIYAMNLANQSMLRLTDNAAIDMQPAFAPDSMRVAYVSNGNGNNDIYLTGLDRRPSVNLTNNSSDDQQPAWSPDGNWIAFTSNRDGNQEIYIMRSDGSELRNLTSNVASDFAPTWFSIPRFFGLGTEDWIAFTSNRDGNQEIYKVRPDGTGLTNLTRNPANDHSPSGFTGGRLLAFVTDRDGNSEIYTMTDDGGFLTNITGSSSQDLNPALDKTGRWVAFTTDRDGNLEVYVINLSDGSIYNLTRHNAQETSPDW